MFVKILVTTLISISVHASNLNSLFIAAHIEPHCQIRIEPWLLGQAPLDLIGGEVARKIAEVNEVSNNPNGYEMFVESVNGGSLINADGVAAPYQLRYGASGSFFTAPSVGSPLSVRVSPSLSGLTFSLIDLYINLPANPSLQGGDYTDTIIFTMTTL